MPRRQSNAEQWRNIPAECRIDWWRHRRRFIPELISDLGLFFNTYDTTYVQRNRYDGMAVANHVRFLQTVRLTAHNAEGERQTLTYAPAHVVKFGPTLGWSWLVLGYTFGIAPDRYGGKTSEFNIASYNSKLGFDLNYTRSSGNFNLRSAQGFPTLERTPTDLIRLEKMRAHTLALNLYYVFNYRHFSYPAAFSLSTVQLRSAGTWLLGIRYDRQQINLDPEGTERALRHFDPDLSLTDGLRASLVRYRQFGLSFGYAYNWVPQRRWLISATVSPSLGYKHQEGENFSTKALWQNLKTGITQLNVDLIARLGIVWTTGRYYAGASAVSYIYDYHQPDFKLTHSIHYFRFYLGLYFHRQKKYRHEQR